MPSPERRRFRPVVVTLLAGVVVGALALALRLKGAVETAVAPPESATVPFDLAPLAEPSILLPVWGSEDITAVVEMPDALYVAGDFGVARLRPQAQEALFEREDLSRALPTRRATALTRWRSRLVAALDAGGLFVREEGAWKELRSALGTLHVRALQESPAGELWIGAREGLFRIAFGEMGLTRRHAKPVRALALVEGGKVLSGGEQGAFETSGPDTAPLKLQGVQTPWIDALAASSGRAVAIGPEGLLREEGPGVLTLGGAGDAASMAVEDSRLLMSLRGAEPLLRTLDADGRVGADVTPSPVRRVFTTGASTFIDTDAGLMTRTPGGFRLVLPRRASGFAGHAHVGALAAHRGRVLVGFFDGGLGELRSDPRPRDPEALWLQGLGDPEGLVWAVNALLAAGGGVTVASLRGVARLEDDRLTTLSGPGAAFSLAATTSGIVRGYGEGVLLPDGRMLSAFQGLPGNQATALSVAGDGLLVGTPSGLGYVQGGRVRWRVAAGEGALSHPWITALLARDEGVLIGTYGGGVIRRKGPVEGTPIWSRPEGGEGLKVNTGCLIEAAGRVYVGTDGRGLLRLTRDGTRLEPLKLPLPSPRVTALLEKDGFLYIGTDEGLTRWRLEPEGRP